jgi:DNA invertase Pin-like site-specific DNA recombinase
VVVWRLDRLGRSLKHLIELVNHLAKQDIGFQSLQEAIEGYGAYSRRNVQ